MPKDSEREHRISMEIIVDAYGPEEQAMGWYYYLEDRLGFPFTAQCVPELRVSPLQKGERVTVVGMAPEEDCMSQMLVQVEWMNREMGVPLWQLKAVDKDPERQEAIADWHYWVGEGRRFC